MKEFTVNTGGMMKILLIRFSSLGDVTQSLSIPAKIKEKYPKAEIHWVTKKEFTELLHHHPAIDCIHRLDKSDGARGLFRLIGILAQLKFDRIYDAHNSLRSKVISISLVLLGWLQFQNIQWTSKPTKRWQRFLLFKFRINKFQMPFSGQRDLLEGLKNWGIDSVPPKAPQLFIKTAEQNILKERLKKMGLTGDFICLAPSAAHDLKKWPLAHWKNLISQLPQHHFLLLGGPQDHFLKDLQQLSPKRIFNTAGLFSYRESAIAVTLSRVLICNDTGPMHFAEQTGHPAIALMGPAPFGFPSRASTSVLEKNLDCRPCSKHGQGPCVNKEFQKCLVDISPEQVIAVLQKRSLV